MTVFYRGSTLHMLVESSVSFFLFSFRCFSLHVICFALCVYACVSFSLFPPTHSFFSLTLWSLFLSLYLSFYQCVFSLRISLSLFLDRSLPIYPFPSHSLCLYISASFTLSFTLSLSLSLSLSSLYLLSLSSLSLSLSLSLSKYIYIYIYLSLFLSRTGKCPLTTF